jgi:hypothetical protein
MSVQCTCFDRISPQHQEFAAIDIDRSGSISFSEYTEYILKHKQAAMKGKECGRNHSVRVGRVFLGLTAAPSGTERRRMPIAVRPMVLVSRMRKAGTAMIRFV